jgi:hypothetical protein
MGICSASCRTSRLFKARPRHQALPRRFKATSLSQMRSTGPILRKLLCEANNSLMAKMTLTVTVPVLHSRARVAYRLSIVDS